AGALDAVDALDALTLGPEERVEVGALLDEEAGVLAVAFPVLDVELTMPDVEVTHDESELGVCRELGHPCGHRVEELVLLDLLRGVHLTRVHVDAHDRDDATVDLIVGLEPAAG